MWSENVLCKCELSWSVRPSLPKLLSVLLVWHPRLWFPRLTTYIFKSLWKHSQLGKGFSTPSSSLYYQALAPCCFMLLKWLSPFKFLFSFWDSCLSSCLLSILLGSASFQPKLPESLLKHFLWVLALPLVPLTTFVFWLVGQAVSLKNLFSKQLQQEMKI